jgi:hypothetical protein
VQLAGIDGQIDALEDFVAVYACVQTFDFE